MPGAGAPTSTWIVATEAAVERWRTLAPGPGPCVGLAWGRARPTLAREAVEAAWTGSGRELVLLTSGEALACLGPTPVRGWPCACVGPHTAALAAERGFSVVLEGAGGFGDLARRLLARPQRPRRVLWLRAREAASTGADALRAAGVEVEERVVYDVEPLAGFAEAVRAAPEPERVLVGSGRAADALFEALAAARRVLPAEAAYLVPGATTASHLRAHGVAAQRIRTLSAPMGG